MKKIIKPFVLVAAAAMALASCQKNEMPAPEKQDVHFTINAGIGTKTSIEETLEGGKTVYKAQWDGNEELGVLFAAPNKDTEAKNVVKLTNAESGEVASFQGNVTLDDEKQAGTFYAFYPATAFYRGYEEGDARLDLKNVQKPTATSFDPTCDILVAKPYDYEVVDGKVEVDDLEFARVMSVLRIDLKSKFADVQNEFVESVSFTAGDVEITGYARIFLDNPKFDKWSSNGAQWRTVTAKYDSDIVSINGESKSVYLVIAPVTIPANKDLTFEIKTKNYNISKTVKSPEMKFTAGKVSKLNLTINEDNCEKIDVTVDYSGEYLIVGDNSGTKYAAVKYDGSSNNLKGLALTMEGDKILEFDGMADSKMIVTKVVGGTYDGLYTIQDASEKYLYAAASGSNNLKSAAISTSTPEHYYWSIVEKDGAYEVIASKSSNRNVMQFNYNNGSPIFSCYASASQKSVALYSYSDIKADTTPKISVANTSYSASAADTSVEIPYTVKNITSAITATVADGATLTNVNATVADGKVTVTFAANEESTEKTATIVLSYEGAESVNVTVSQEGKASEGVKEETVIYETAFNYAIQGSAYNSATEIVGNDAAGTSWGITYGNWNGSNCAQLRVYSAAKFGSIYMKFDVANATRVSYKAKVTNTALKLNTYYSTDSGATWTKVNSAKALTTTLTAYEFTISESGEYSKVRVKFEAAGSAPSSNNYQLTVDDVAIYGFKNAGGETPEPEEPETPDTPTPSANSYTKYSGEIVEGDYIIVYDNAAMNTTVTSNRLQFATVSPSNDVISDPDASIVWHIAKSGDYWTIYNASANKYAASTGTKNQAQMLASGTDNKSLWTVSGTSTYEFVNENNKANNVNSNLRKNSSYGFACYAGSTGGALTLYKKN